MASNKFTLINKSDRVIVVRESGTIKTYPKNAFTVDFDPKQNANDTEQIIISSLGSPTKETLATKVSQCQLIIDEVAGSNPTIGATLQLLYDQISAFFFRNVGSTFIDTAFSSVININGNFMMEAGAGNIALTDGGNHINDKTIIIRIPQEDGRTFTYPASWVLRSTSDDYDNTLDNLIVIYRRFDITYITIINTPVV